MEFRILLPKHYYGEAGTRGRVKTIEINPGYTALIGPNGAGKTTFLRQIEEQCNARGDCIVIHYDNMSDGGDKSMQRALMSSNISFVAQMALSSEGEGIYANICELATKIGGTCSRARGKKSVFVLLDGMDSGLSIDKIMNIRKNLIDFAIDIETEHGGSNLYFICTANNYELAKDAAQLDVCTAKYVNLTTYAKFVKYIMKNSKHKEELGYGKAKISKTEKTKPSTIREADRAETGSQAE